MKEQGRISMSRKELDRVVVIREVIEKKVLQKEAAERLGISVRQIKRLVRQFRKKGPEGLIHPLRGKASKRAFKSSLREKILNLWKQQYTDFGPVFFAEKPWKRNKLPFPMKHFATGFLKIRGLPGDARNVLTGNGDKENPILVKWFRPTVHCMIGLKAVGTNVISKVISMMPLAMFLGASMNSKELWRQWIP